MNAKFVYPMTLAAFLAFGASTLSTAYAQEAEQPQQEEQQPKGEGSQSND